MANMDFDLKNPDKLFGNDAAEDEIESVFNSYAIARSEVTDFLDESKPLQVVRAYKGEGKSTLLRLVEATLKAQAQAPLVLRTTGVSLSPALDTTDSDLWVQEWKRSIVKYIASEIGARINVAFSDDGIALVEEAERNGFRSRSFVSSIFDRLKFTELSIERGRPEMASHEAVLKRWLRSGTTVWLIIDDIDQNFRNEPKQKVKVAGCFMAMRQLFSQIPELRIRMAVRPNVWASIKPEFEALSHVEQYVVDLNWSEASFRDILFRRIEGYLKRSSQWDLFTPRADLEARKDQLISMVFETPVSWGGENRKRPIHVVLYTLSRHRPRWMIELCKVASKHSMTKGRQSIALDDVIKQLESFGTRRIQDTIAEFKPQCAEIENLIIAFSGQNERFATDELIDVVNRRVLQGVHPKIDGVIGSPSAKEVAHFLFQIGFLSARLDRPDGTYDHLTFFDRPNLLRATTNLDEGVSWEIHPVYRQALKLKDVASKSELVARGKRGR